MTTAGQDNAISQLTRKMSINLIYDPERKYIDQGDACPTSFKLDRNNSKKAAVPEDENMNESEMVDAPMEEEQQEKKEQLPFAHLGAADQTHSEVYDHRDRLFCEMK